MLSFRRRWMFGTVAEQPEQAERALAGSVVAPQAGQHYDRDQRCREEYRGGSLSGYENDRKTAVSGSHCRRRQRAQANPQPQ
jgi:hypothetical protein